MPQLSQYAFQFQSQAVPQDTFAVVRFHGEEGLSQLYQFDILLISEKADLDLEAILQSPATFTIKGQNAELPYHGFLSSLEQLHQAEGWVFYRATLRPKLWWLTLTHHNQVFLNTKIDQFLADVLEDGGLSRGLDFEFRLQGSYPTWDYLCQYRESHFAFVSRWMERDGIYYWFEQEEKGEKMVATDSFIAHTPLPGYETFIYSPPSGLDASHADEVIKSFSLRRTPMPQTLRLKDYHYEKPSLDLSAQAVVAQNGRGEIYLYGEHFKDLAEGKRLAKIRAEEYQCREQVFHGLSTVPAMRPGYVFSLTRHYRSDFNQRYLTTAVHHEGSQERYLISGLSVPGLSDKDNLFYRNSFQCIPASVQFRPPRITEKPRITGTLSAKIDAAGSGQYAELDDQGRYKVILPFDLSGRSGGKASAYIRMMQPYAGQGMGFHAPLHKGTEVLLSFIDGDPDRPVIAGAIPNPETPSPVTDKNQTMVQLTTGGGNKLHFQDQDGKQGILLHSPTAGTYLSLGSKPQSSDAEHGDEEEHHGDEEQHDTHEEGGEKGEGGEGEKEWAVELFTNEGLKIQAAFEDKMILGAVVDTVVGETVKTHLAGVGEVIAGLVLAAKLTGTYEFEKELHKTAFVEFKELLEHHKISVDSLEVVASKKEEIENCLSNYAQKTEISEIENKIDKEVTNVKNNLLQIINDNKLDIIGKCNEFCESQFKKIDIDRKINELDEKIIAREKVIIDDVTQIRNTVNNISEEVSELNETVSVIATVIQLG